MTNFANVDLLPMGGTTESSYKELLNSIDGIVWESDASTFTFTFVSEKAEALLGFPIERWYEPNFWASQIHPEDRDRAISYCVAATGRGEDHQFEYRMACADGSYIWLKDIVSYVIAEDGTKLLRGVMLDITDRKKLEEQLLQSQKMEAIGQLAGGVAHDFNNLLTAIIGYSDLVLRKLSASDPIAKHVEEIRKSGNRAAGLTRQLLAFSRKQIMQPRLLDLNSVVHEIEQILRRLIGESIELAVSTDPLLGVVRADPGQIEQVVLNLAVNARDAMTEGGKIEITTQNTTLDETSAIAVGLPAGEYICLAVSDNGTGIDTEHIDHVFEPFFTTKETGKGTGLGLSTVYGIVRQSGGQATVESLPGSGTTFRVYLPRISESGPQDVEVLEAKMDCAGTETILLVEDEPVVRNLVENILVQNGYTVHTASDGAEALDIAELDIDLLITDVVMPGMDGTELAARFTAIYPNLKVMFISGYSDESVFGVGDHLSNRSFVQKPFLPDELATRVRAVLDEETVSIHASS